MELFGDTAPILRKANNLRSGVKPLSDETYSFEVVGVRCNSDRSTGKKKLKSNQIYYFLEGIKIEGEKFEIDESRKNIDRLYTDYCRINSGASHIQVSAIVGKNGCGKSTLVEFMIRLINNFAAVLYGDRNNVIEDNKLHYIEGMAGDLWWITRVDPSRDFRMFQLHVDHNLVTIKELFQFKSTYSAVYLYRVELNPDGTQTRYQKDGDFTLLGALVSFFYTVVMNYSIYAYNTDDFISESNSFERPEECRTAYDYSTSSWIDGLFSKDDSYEIPLVITPERVEGDIKIKHENSLAVERLTSLLITNENLRIINGHLEVLEFEINTPEHPIDDTVIKKMTFGDIEDKDWYEIKARVVLAWSNKVDEDLTKYADKVYYNDAITYLTYKTLDIARNYSENIRCHIGITSLDTVKDLSYIDKIVEYEASDLSFATRKIFRTLGYLIYDVYDFSENASQIELIKPLIIEANWRKNAYPKFIKDKDFSRNPIGTKIWNESLLPPPFLKYDIRLRDTISVTDKGIKFSSLSSGERQLTHTVCSLLYHIDKFDSIYDNKNLAGDLSYSNILIILEEIELYFHPAFQQELIKYLLDGISQMSLEHIKGIHLMLVTHSPYVLSDIPKENVLALNDDGTPSERKIKSFGANIHEMLRDSFFMPHGTIGDFAQWETGHIMALLDVHRKYREFQKASTKTFIDSVENRSKSTQWIDLLDELKAGSNPIYNFMNRYMAKENGRRIFDYSEFNNDFSESYLSERIKVIDEPLVRNILEKELITTFPKSEEDLKKERVRMLEEELEKARKELGNV